MAAAARWRRRGAPAAAAAAAVVVSLLLAAAPRASASVLASFQFDFAEARNQFGWTITSAPPNPTMLQVPAGGNGSVAYSTAFQRQLLSTKLRVGGIVTFENQGDADAIVAGGRVSICNGHIDEAAANATGAAAAFAGCSGSSYSVLLGVKPNYGALIPAGARAGVPFEGSFAVQRVTSEDARSRGIGGPVAAAYVDAILTDGSRVASPVQKVSFGIDADLAGDFGYTGTAFDEFMNARIAVLTAKPIDTMGNKIPDGFGMRISDSQTFNYTAIFSYTPGTPCDVPLTATNRVRLVVNNPGDAPVPEAQTSLVTVVFTGCNTTASARFGQIEPFVNSTYSWSLSKTADTSALRLAPGAAGNITYRVAVTRAPPTVRYRVSGAVLVSPVGGVLGGPPLQVSAVEVQLSSGDKGPAGCLPPNPDGSTPCVFESIPYSLDSLAPLAGNATATVRLADGSTLEVPATPFDFMRVPTNEDAGARANLTDTLDAPAVGAARAAGLRFIWDERLKPPSTREAPVVLTEATVYEYSIKVRAGAKCGSHRLVNTAGLAPIGGTQKAMLARSEVAVDVIGCN
ncbi:hypothetical protein Rsub_10396 [Raphidocelis subcapitata]|uniref:Uncharacterized protein n=1 Tax=Raphidocelis subcapitata TaxID=307507 RepID=A0A2V0PHS6_9CHLO|nr:hypothetical protein Rsub_10396 [Raphidocelis subcapitata]|eukprot:GBF97473.1 hypothetical protein Rsub_10396 [Raphidocelis subcapitata]